MVTRRRSAGVVALVLLGALFVLAIGYPSVTLTLHDPSSGAPVATGAVQCNDVWHQITDGALNGGPLDPTADQPADDSDVSTASDECSQVLDDRKQISLWCLVALVGALGVTVWPSRQSQRPGG